MSKKNDIGGMNAAVLVRRLLFFVLLFGLVFFYLVLTFQGLTSAKGMEHAQLGREIARGNDYTTKMIRPAAIWQANNNAEENESGTEVQLDSFIDTYNAPLQPFIYSVVLKAVGGDEFANFQMTEDKNTIYRLDRVIAAISVICFLVAIGVNYLLVSRIFDVRIAGVTATLMALSDLMWKFTHTGLPQMLMLLLFSCAMFFAYRALEATIEGKSAMGSIIVAAAFLALLVLTKWLAIWLVVGFAVYAAFTFRPRGASSIIIVAIVALSSGYFMIRNIEHAGNIGGAASLNLYAGILDSEDGLMRTSDPSDDTYQVLYNLKNLILNTTRGILTQAHYLYNNLGAIVAAPLFFLALIHPFKRPSIARFRWMILIIWLFATVGMALYGLSSKSTDPNQLHILFAPLMTAYGLAFLSILWSRLELPAGGALIRYGHFVAIIALSAGPLVLTIPRGFKSGLARGDAEFPVWPPYWPPLLSRTLHNATTEESIIVSDQPWAVAWYADRHSIWLPRKVSELEDFESLAEEQKLIISGILTSPSSFEKNPLFKPSPFGKDEEFASLMLDPISITLSKGRSAGMRIYDPGLSSVISRYGELTPLFPGRIHYYSRQPIVTGN